MSSPFEIFNLPVDFNISLKELDRRYFDLQKHAHPDFCGQYFDSSTINQAYQALKDPFFRAKAVLVALGGQTEQLPSDEFLENCLTQTISAREEWNKEIVEFEQNQNNLKKMEEIFSKLIYLRRLL